MNDDPTIIDPYVAASAAQKADADGAADLTSATASASSAAQIAINAANALPEGAYNKAAILAAAQAALAKSNDALKTKAFADATLETIQLITDIDRDVKAAVANAVNVTAPSYGNGKTGAYNSGRYNERGELITTYEMMHEWQDGAVNNIKTLADGLQVRQNELEQKMRQLLNDLNGISEVNRMAAQYAYNATNASTGPAQEAIDETQNFYVVTKDNYKRDSAAGDDLIIKAGYGPGASYAGGKTTAAYAAESDGGAFTAADNALNNIPNLQAAAAQASDAALAMAKDAAADALDAATQAQWSMQFANTDDEYLNTLSDDEKVKLLKTEEAYRDQLQAQFGSDNWLVRYVQNTTTGAWIPQFYNADELEKAIYNENDISHSFIGAYTLGSAKRNEEIKNVNARIEQDSSGRLINITLNPDSPDAVTHALTTNTIADQERYDDAINQYEYEKYRYDQSINEINAKIEIIQAQDKNLELRLKQLDTEQNAISTEMDAVSKVIQKNVESTFKTFG